MLMLSLSFGIFSAVNHLVQFEPLLSSFNIKTTYMCNHTDIWEVACLSATLWRHELRPCVAITRLNYDFGSVCYHSIYIFCSIFCPLSNVVLSSCNTSASRIRRVYFTRSFLSAVRWLIKNAKSYLPNSNLGLVVG